MTYLIVEIWAFIVAASLIGVLMGALLRGGSSASQVQTLKQQLVAAQNEASEQRKEAHRLAAASPSTATGAQLVALEKERDEAVDTLTAAQSEIAALRDEVESLGAGAVDEARRAAASEADRANALQAELNDARAQADETTALMADVQRLTMERDAARADAANTPAPGPTVHDELIRLRARVSDLEPAEAEVARLREDLAAAASTSEDGAAMQARVTDLETELSAKARESREETASLRARIVELETDLASARKAASDPAPLAAAGAAAATLTAAAGGNDAGGEEDTSEIAQRTWRNRYLSSRVRFLEQRLEDASSPDDDATIGAAAPNGDGGAADALRAELARAQARIDELERDGPKPAAAPAGGADGEPDEASLEWRNRYLSSRVKYLESRLEEAEATPDDREPAPASAAAAFSADREREEAAAAEATRLRARIVDLEKSLAEERAAERPDAEPKSDGDYALEWRNRYLSSRVKYLEERLADDDAPAD